MKRFEKRPDCQPGLNRREHSRTDEASRHRHHREPKQDRIVRFPPQSLGIVSK
jgi:hypothetical protein